MQAEKPMSEAESKVAYRLKELERAKIVELIRGRNLLQCYIGPAFYKYFKTTTENTTSTLGGDTNVS